MARYPVDNRIKTGDQIPFGGADSNAKFGRHAGDDSANGTGTNVYAPATGTVTGYTSSQYHGKVVEIFDGKYYPHVFHLKDQTVSPGQKVTEGQLIGHSNNTGLSTGPHVHFGVSKVSVPNTKSFDDYLDPMEYIKQAPVEGDPPMNKGDVYNNMVNLENHNPSDLDYSLWVGKTDNQYLNERGFDFVKKQKLNPGDVENMYYHLGVKLDDEAKKFWTGHYPLELFYAIINSDEYKNRHK